MRAEAARWGAEEPPTLGAGAAPFAAAFGNGAFGNGVDVAANPQVRGGRGNDPLREGGGGDDDPLREGGGGGGDPLRERRRSAGELSAPGARPRQRT